MNIDATLATNCETCGRQMSVDYRWNMGQIQPCPSQIRIAVLRWDAKVQELIEMTLNPDVSVLVLCEACREEICTEIATTVLRLREKRPMLMEAEGRVH